MENFNRRTLEKQEFLTIDESCFYIGIEKKKFLEMFEDGYFFKASMNNNLIVRASLDTYMLTGMMARNSVQVEKQKQAQEKEAREQAKKRQKELNKEIKSLEKELSDPII